MWSGAWDDILKGGDPRWKRGEGEANTRAQLTHLHSLAGEYSLPSSLSIFVPLAGDCPIVHAAWMMGHKVTANEFVPVAVTALRRVFSAKEEDWKCEEIPAGKKWTYVVDGRVIIYECDIFTSVSELLDSFDIVFDKDAYGALSPPVRRGYMSVLSSYLRHGGIMYCEAKKKLVDADKGPPFDVTPEDIKGNVDGLLTYVRSLGEVYDWGDKSQYLQIGHVLKRE